MSRKLSINNAITFILTIALILLAFHTKAKGESEYDYHKIVLTWAPSFCNTGENQCEKPIKRMFFIHGLWPMYLPNTFVPPYNDQTPCTTVKPENAEAITKGYLNSILGDMNKHWRNLLDYKSSGGNLHFWRYQWKTHGMCFKNPDNPFHYFNTTISFVKNINILAILKKGGAEPDDLGGLAASVYAGIINEAMGVKVEISCNRKGENLQLLEIGICFQKEGPKMSCPNEFHICQESDVIWLPKA